jgi:hypothetical protein
MAVPRARIIGISNIWQSKRPCGLIRRCRVRIRPSWYRPGYSLCSHSNNVLASRPGFSSICCRTYSQTVLNGSSRVRQCRTFVTSLGKLAVVAVFLRVIGHPPRRTRATVHDPNTYAGQVSRRLDTVGEFQNQCYQHLGC